ncbi:MAG: type II toxin-antitoxin system RelE/ParE family toxin [Candidatus Micrarchaeia archaeon]
MSYELVLSETVEKRFFKLGKKNKKALTIIWKKLAEVLRNPHRFKPLKNRLAGCYRIHILTSFVITYEIREYNKTVFIIDFEHHDKAYK